MYKGQATKKKKGKRDWGLSVGKVRATTFLESKRGSVNLERENLSAPCSNKY